MLFMEESEVIEVLRNIIPDEFQIFCLQTKIKDYHIRDLYKITFKEKSPMRLEITEGRLEYCKLHNICYDKGVNISKELFSINENKLHFRVVEFIEGKLLEECWSDLNNFIELGKLVRSIHNIKIDGKTITNKDMSKRNCVIPPESNSLYIIDTDMMILGDEKDIEKTFTYITEKCLRKDTDRINKFYEGYYFNDS